MLARTSESRTRQFNNAGAQHGVGMEELNMRAFQQTAQSNSESPSSKTAEQKKFGPKILNPIAAHINKALSNTVE